MSEGQTSGINTSSIVGTWCSQGQKALDLDIFERERKLPSEKSGSLQSKV